MRACRGPPPPSNVAAGKAGDEDTEDRDDTINNDLDARGDCVDDAHDAGSDGAEEVSDARKDGTHFESCLCCGRL
jgi:hypothetical protein